MVEYLLGHSYYIWSAFVKFCQTFIAICKPIVNLIIRIFASGVFVINAHCLMLCVLCFCSLSRTWSLHGNLIFRNIIKFDLSSREMSLQAPALFSSPHDVKYFSTHEGKMSIVSRHDSRRLAHKLRYYTGSTESKIIRHLGIRLTWLRSNAWISNFVSLSICLLSCYKNAVFSPNTSYFFTHVWEVGLRQTLTSNFATHRYC